MSRYHRGLLFVLGTAIISGFSIWLNAFAVKGIDPSLFTGLKNLYVGLIIVAFVLLSKEWKKVLNLNLNQWIRLLLVGLVGGSVPFVLFFTGLSMTTGAKAGFIHKTLFIYVAIAAFFLLKEKITGKIFIGLAALFIGQILFLQISPQTLTLGDLFIFGATLLWAAEVIISKGLLKTVAPNVVAGARMLFGGVFIWIYMYATGQAETVASLTFSQMNWILITTLLLLGYVMTFYHGLKYVPAHVATSILAIGAPITFLLSAVFLDKAVSSRQIFGMLIIAAGILIITRFVAKAAKSTHHVLARDNQ